MQNNLLIPITFLFLSCTYLPESKGQANEIIVITSPEDKIFIEPLLSDLFSQTIHTPQLEQIFDLKYRKPWDFEIYEDYANIIIVSLHFPKDSTADILTQRILKKHKMDVQLVTFEDLYVKNQLICIINTLDAVAFKNIVDSNSEWILNEHNILFEKKIKLEVFKNGKNIDLSNKIVNILGHTIDLQPDFKLIKSDSLRSFVWVGRGYPYRWITLHKSRKDSYINSQSAWLQLQYDFSLHMPELIISKHFQINEKVSIGKNKIRIMRGIYEHSKSDSGGPFFVYIFDTEQTNEVILINGFVNYPGHEKLLLLKQLEIMAKTIHKGEPT